jgi:hypothetical protein
MVSVRSPATLSSLVVLCRWGAYLAILKLEDQLHLVALDLLLDNLGGNPAVGRVGLPRPGAIFVNVCHGGGGVPLTVRVQEALRSEAIHAPARG